MPCNVLRLHFVLPPPSLQAEFPIAWMKAFMLLQRIWRASMLRNTSETVDQCSSEK